MHQALSHLTLYCKRWEAGQGPGNEARKGGRLGTKLPEHGCNSSVFVSLVSWGALDVNLMRK